MSIWGVNNAPSAPSVVTAGGDVACAAGTETNVLSGTVSAPTPGANYALNSDVSGVIVLGATPPTALVIAIRVGAGADYDSYTVNAASLVASAILQIGPTLTGIFGRNALIAGVTVNVTVNATAQAVTFKAGGRVVHSLSLGPDV